MIRPGLDRIRRLLHGISLPWRAIHVAGTNGKGSVCSYLSAMLHKANIRTGRFTSPHLIDRWDCIRIDEKPISESTFLQVEGRVKSRNVAQSIEATPFELLTATAFEIFKQEQVQVGVVECGMGGRLDSTNVLENPLATVITSIGLDHEAFLGTTLEEIARQKAGIMKSGSPCVAESTNEMSVIETLKQIAKDVDVVIHVEPLPNQLEWLTGGVPSTDKSSAYITDRSVQETPSDSSADPFLSIQLRNKWLAYQALSLAMPALGLPEEYAKSLAPAMANVEFPGRFQNINLLPLIGRSRKALLDGAHNEHAMKAIRQYRASLSIDPHGTVDTAPHSCTWVIACSSTKGDIFHIPKEDHVVITEFGLVEGMPWVKPKPVEEVLVERVETGASGLTVREPDVLTALKRACEISNEGQLIIVGSLYLVSDVLRLLRDVAK